LIESLFFDPLSLCFISNDPHVKIKENASENRYLLFCKEMIGMMDYRYRRMAYELVTEQRDEIIEECKKNYQKKQPDKIDHFKKTVWLALQPFFNIYINQTKSQLLFEELAFLISVQIRSLNQCG
jgi:hypothetical protein